MNHEIAKYSGISLSNFNYHFPTKRKLVLSIFSYMKVNLSERINQNINLKRESSPLNLVKIYIEFENEFKFFYLDTYNVISHYDFFGKELLIQIDEAILLIKNLIYVDVGKGFIRHGPGITERTYDDLSNQIWLNCHFWFAQSYIRNKNDNILTKCINACFNLLKPYLTEEGHKKYMNFINGLK